MMDPSRREYTDVSLPDLAKSTNILDGLVVYRCRVSGPALLMLGDGSIFANNWSSSGPDEGLF